MGVPLPVMSPQENVAGSSDASAISGVVTPRGVQTIVFEPLFDRVLGSSPFNLVATGGQSELPVTFSTKTPSVCSLGGILGAAVSFLMPGTCIIVAEQRGNDGFAPAANVERSFLVLASDAPLVLSFTASQAKLTAGENVRLMALVRGANPAGLVTFRVGMNALPGCNNVSIKQLADSGSDSVAICEMNNISPGDITVEAFFVPTSNRPAQRSEVRLEVSALGPRNYSDMWWSGTEENGWGMAISQKGSVQFNALYVYSDIGKPVWYVMPGGTWSNNFTTYSGLLYQPISAPYNAYDPGKLVVGASVGTATITFRNTNDALLTYTIAGVSAEKFIVRQKFGATSDATRLIVNDMWWAGTSENGWGVTIAQQSEQLFAVWFTYGLDGNATWYVMPGGSWAGARFIGSLYETKGSSWLGVPYIASRLNISNVGTLTFDFVNARAAKMTYSLNGLTQSKDIVRQPF